MENKEKMKYLSLSWFKSKIENAVDKATDRIISKKIEGLVDELSNTEVEDLEQSEQVSETAVSNQLSIAFEKPYATIIEVNDSVTVVLKDGRVLSKQGVSSEEIKKATSEEEVLKLMSSEEGRKEIEKVQELRKEVELVQSNFAILEQTGDFEVKEGSVYLKGINRSMPKLLVNKFASVLTELKDTSLFEKEYLDDLKDDIEYNSLMRFWKKCCLNPNAQSAEDLYAFLEKHNMKIDQHGNFYAYRRVQTVDTGNSKELIDFVSNAYNKIKAVWKKKVDNYVVHKSADGKYFLMGIAQNGYDSTKDVSYVGNLKDLYLNLPNLAENRYTSSHTGREDYRVGNVISMPRNEGDDDNRHNCSMGFHAASKEYDYTGFGNQDILVIINPMDVLAVPQNEIGKLRTCRWYFAMTLEEGERFILDEDCFDVTYLGDIFEEKCLEDLEEHVKRGFTEEVKRHTFTLPSIGHKEIQAICKDLSSIKSELSERVIKV